MDLPKSIKPNNIMSMLGVGATELGLVKYLVGELTQSPRDRIGTWPSSRRRRSSRTGS